MGLIFFGNSVMGSSNLPPCKGPDRSNWNNCFGDRTYLNRDYYVGEWKDGKRHGQGTYYFYADNQFKGDKYVGEFKEDKRSGQGTLTKANGDIQIGEWKDGLPVGKGGLPTPATSKCKNTPSAKSTYRTRYEDLEETMLVWVEDPNKLTALSISNTELIPNLGSDLAYIKVNFIGLKKIHEYEAKARLEIEERIFEASPVSTLLGNTILLGLPLILGPGKQLDNAFGCTETISQKLVPSTDNRTFTGSTKWIEFYPREVYLSISGLTKEPVVKFFSIDKNDISIVLRDFIDIKKSKDILNIQIECMACNEPEPNLINGFRNKINLDLNLRPIKKVIEDSERAVRQKAEEERAKALAEKQRVAEKASQARAEASAKAQAAEQKTLDLYKDKCSKLGFKEGTDSFGKCVLQLTR